MRKLIVLLFFITSSISYSQEETELKTYSFEEVEKLHKETPKPVVVFIQADWCQICRGMEKTTLANKKVIALLNESFYFIKFNGEEKKDILFLGNTYVFKPYGSSGTHELALKLATIDKRMSYPTTAILDKEFGIVLQLEGLTNKRRMASVLMKARKL
jgi:thioredoxin-related protein